MMRRTVLRKTEIAAETVKIMIISAGVGILFYNSYFGLVPGLIVSGFVVRKDIRRIKEKRRKEILLAFKSLIGAIDAALAAGYSLENAFLSAEHDMSLLYPQNSTISRELRMMKQKLLVRIPLQELLYEFGERNNLEEVKDFAVVIATVRKTGGNTVKIIRKTVENISLKIDVDQEIQVMVAAKQMEKRIMTVMPPLIIIYLRAANPDYMNPVYGNLPGILFMTVCLAMILIADAIGEKIIRIEV